MIFQLLSNLGLHKLAPSWHRPRETGHHPWQATGNNTVNNFDVLQACHDLLNMTETDIGDDVVTLKENRQIK